MPYLATILGMLLVIIFFIFVYFNADSLIEYENTKSEK